MRDDAIVTESNFFERLVLKLKTSGSSSGQGLGGPKPYPNTDTHTAHIQCLPTADPRWELKWDLQSTVLSSRGSWQLAMGNRSWATCARHAHPRRSPARQEMTNVAIKPHHSMAASHC